MGGQSTERWHLLGVAAAIVGLSAVWWQFWVAALLVFPVAALIYGVIAYGRRSAMRRRENAAIVARADSQHSAVLRGEMDWGAFGWLPCGRTLPGPAPRSRRAFIVAAWWAVLSAAMLAALATCAQNIRPTPEPPQQPAFPTVTQTVQPPGPLAPVPIPFPPDTRVPAQPT